jgi:hypothetical protein
VCLEDMHLSAHTTSSVGRTHREKKMRIKARPLSPPGMQYCGEPLNEVRTGSNFGRMIY